MQKKNQPLSGDEIFLYVALAFMLTLMVVGIGYAAWINRPTPTIDTNHNFQVTRIETRNFKEGEWHRYSHFGDCRNIDGSTYTCIVDDDYWVGDTFEWREAGKYENADEGWVKVESDVKPTDTEYAYRKVSDWDVVRDAPGDSRNGQVVKHVHLDEFYL